LTSKTSRRSGVAKMPKFSRWASPHACTRSPLTGVEARASAITAAAPRKNENGEAIMRR
jgi:hypothetical protein